MHNVIILGCRNRVLDSPNPSLEILETVKDEIHLNRDRVTGSMQLCNGSCLQVIVSVEVVHEEFYASGAPCSPEVGVGQKSRNVKDTIDKYSKEHHDLNTSSFFAFICVIL